MGVPVVFRRASKGFPKGFPWRYPRGMLFSPTPEFCLDNILDLVYLFEEYKLFGLCRNINILWLCGGLGKWNIHCACCPHPRILCGGENGPCVCV